MSVFNFKPARTKVQDTDIVSDLDALIEKPIAIKLLGKIHVIKPINTATFFQVTNALAKMDAMKNEPNYTKDQLIDSYTMIFSSVCDTIGKEEIECMTQAQVGALFKIVLDTITGKAHIDAAAESEKKKTMSPSPSIA